MPTATTGHYTPATFKFLRALARHNERPWFKAHQADYDTHVRAASLALIEEIAPLLKGISPELVADPRPVGGSLFRIHRDIRFSNDKRPYKTAIGIYFFHRATRTGARGADRGGDRGRLDAPGLYLHVEPGASFVGGGLWHPQTPTLKRIRDFMVDNPESWKQATRARAFRAHFELTGDALARPPRGYRPDHELIEDLKRKDFVASSAVPDAELLSPRLAPNLVRQLKAMGPMLEWLCLALDLPF